MTNSEVTGRLPRAEATQRFDLDRPGMLMHMPNLKLGTYFPRLFRCRPLLSGPSSEAAGAVIVLPPCLR